MSEDLNFANTVPASTVPASTAPDSARTAQATASTEPPIPSEPLDSKGPLSAAATGATTAATTGAASAAANAVATGSTSFAADDSTSDRRTDHSQSRGRPYNAGRPDRSDRAHRTDRSDRSDRFERSDRAPRASVVALIDAEFWRWWQDLPDGVSERDAGIRARQTVRDALAQARDALQLQRVVWVGEKPLVGLDDLRAMTVNHNEDDDGWPLVRALSQALFDLAGGGVINTVVLATDDDRLLPAIDEVQRRGMRVLMLQGEEKKMSDEWRRLLRAADRTLVPGEGRASGPGSGSAARGTDDTAGPFGNAGAGRSHNERNEAMGSGRDRPAEETHEPPTAEVLQTLNESAGQWWSDLDDASREALREAIPQSRGLPRDFDRQLLIAAARTLDRQLTVPEKHALRGAARAVAGEARETA